MDHLMKNMYDVITEALEIRKDDFLANHKDIDCIHRVLYLFLLLKQTKTITYVMKLS